MMKLQRRLNDISHTPNFYIHIQVFKLDPPPPTQYQLKSALTKLNIIFLFSSASKIGGLQLEHIIYLFRLGPTGTHAAQVV